VPGPQGPQGEQGPPGSVDNIPEDIELQANKAQPDGYTPLDSAALVPAAHMPWDAVAGEISNPESVVNDAVNNVATAALNVGAEGLMKVIDARENLSMPRPNWGGELVWLINQGSSLPANLADGDAVWEVAVEALPWNPQFLPGKVAWYDAQQLSLADGAQVSSWPDLSGNGNTMKQETPALCPVFTANKINGKPAVSSDGLDDYLAADLTTQIPSFPGTIYMVAGVGLPDKPAFADFLISGFSSGSPQNTAIFRSSTEMYAVANGASLTGTVPWPSGQTVLLKAVYNGPTSQLFANGVEVVSGLTSTGAGLLISKLFLFGKADLSAQNMIAGWVGECLLVRGVLSAENETKLLDYLKPRWGLTY
jgi:hypothetical protein